LNQLVKLSSLLILTLPVVLNCTAGDVKSDYKIDPATGVRYIFYKHNSSGDKPALGDIAFVRISYKRDDDSLLFDSHSGGRTDSAAVIPLTLKSVFHASLEEGIAMMAAGDSASFLVSADSLYLKAFKLKALPHFIKNGSDLKFYIKLVKFESPAQLKDEQMAKIEKRREEMAKMQHSEADSIRKFLAKNNIIAKPLMVDSIYILERTGIPGKSVNDGDSILVKYTGMLLDGTVFDQSNKGDGGPGTYKLLYKHNAQLIHGWIDVLGSMHEGEKVKFLLPSSMAYGPFGAGKQIPPYTSLIFEIEILKVITPFDK
jgi:FKBP-type peptidyl-prolyl cis-trans isomerase FkpA